MQIAAPARCHTQQEGDELNVLEQEKSHAFPGKQVRGSTGSPSCGGEQPAWGAEPLPNPLLPSFTKVTAGNRPVSCNVFKDPWVKSFGLNFLGILGFLDPLKIQGSLKTLAARLWGK